MIEQNEVHLENEQTLLSQEWKHALARRLNNEGVSRMGGFLFLLAMVLDFWESGGKIVNEHGAAIHIHLDIIEYSYANELSFSWTTDVKQFADQLPERRSKKSLLLRLQLWDAAYKIDGRPIVLD